MSRKTRAVVRQKKRGKACLLVFCLVLRSVFCVLCYVCRPFASFARPSDRRPHGNRRPPNRYRHCSRRITPRARYRLSLTLRGYCTMIVQPPRVQVKLKRDKFAQQHATSNRKKGSASCFRNVIETVVFLGWLIFTGIGGYFLGQTPLSQDAACPPITAPTAPPLAQQVEAVKCIPRPKSTAPAVAAATVAAAGGGATSGGVGMAMGAVDKEGGFTMDELRTMWTCSHAVETASPPQVRAYRSRIVAVQRRSHR